MFFLFWAPIPSGWRVYALYDNWQVLAQASGRNRQEAVDDLFPQLNYSAKEALKNHRQQPDR